MISYRSHHHKIPTLTAFRLALSDSVLLYSGACPWAKGTRNHEVYSRTKTAALLSMTPDSRPFFSYLLHTRHRTAACEDCNQAQVAQFICSNCGSFLCPACDMLHHCQPNPTP